MANLGAAHSRSASDFGTVPFTEFRSDKGTAGFAVTHSSQVHSLSVAPAANYIESQELVTLIERHFTTFTGTAQAYLKLPDQFSASGLLNWQYAWERLLPGEHLFTIGGPTTVRGYPTNVVSGDSGYFLNLELHYNFAALVPGLDVFAFYDQGSVYSIAPDRQLLTSSGLGLSWTPVPAITAEFTAAFAGDKLAPDHRREQYYFRFIVRPLELLQQGLKPGQIPS
jgi:hemolysin activation/secretion protein